VDGSARRLSRPPRAPAGSRAANAGTARAACRMVKLRARARAARARPERARAVSPRRGGRRARRFLALRRPVSRACADPHAGRDRNRRHVDGPCFAAGGAHALDRRLSAVAARCAVRRLVSHTAARERRPRHGGDAGQVSAIGIAGTGRAWLSIAAGVLAAGCGGSSSPPIGAEPPPGGPDPGPVLGLDARPSNAACTAPALTPTSDADIAIERVFAELQFDEPLGMLHEPAGGERWFVLEKGGRVRVFADDPETAAFDSDLIVLDVNDDVEGGLLGMAFHPDYPARPEVFLSFTEGSPMVSVVARSTSNDGGATLDPGSRQDVIRANQPFANHNGGHIVFGPDGYLYIGLGGRGSAGDPDGRAQDTTDLLGALLRLDVDGGSPYAIPAGPAGNPFAGNPLCPADHTSSTDCPELFAWGLRNPWRFSFDRGSGALWLADVGQSAREEIDVV